MRMRPWKREGVLAGAIVVLFLLPLFGVRGFYRAGNLLNLAVDNLPILAAAIGMTAVILVGEIDISIGSLFAVCGPLAGLAARAGWPMPLVALATIAAGAALGAANGTLVVLARVPSIVATLATMAIMRSAIISVAGGAWIQDLPGSFQWFGVGQANAQPLYLALTGLLWAAAVWALKWTSAGRSLYAVGCDPEAARRIGIRPQRVVFAAFVLLGALTAVAALLNFTRYPTIETNAGLGFELQVIAAVVVGGASVTGGKGSLVGTILGVALLGAIGTVFTFLHLNPAWGKAIQGAIILAAVISDTGFTREARRA